MPLCRRAVVTFENISGLPADRMVNVFHFLDTAGTPAAPVDIALKVEDFYNTDHTGTSGPPPAGFLSGVVSRTSGSATVKIYDVPAAPGPVGSPTGTFTWTPAAKSGPAVELPAEVACCLSFHANLTDVPEESGGVKPAARKRGRIFFGPLHVGAIDGAVSAVPHPANSLVQALTKGCQLGLMVGDTDGAELAVFSRTAWTAALVSGAFVDNAFDTQRRRGPKATGRTSVGT